MHTFPFNQPFYSPLSSAIALQFTIRNSPAECGAKEVMAYISTLKKMWKSDKIVQKCCAGLILVELSSFYVSCSNIVQKKDIHWLLSTMTTGNVEEGVLLGILKLLGGVCENNHRNCRLNLFSALSK